MTILNFAQDSLTNWFQLLFMVIGGFYALYLLRKSNRDKRNKLILDILDRFMGDSDIKTILYSVDQGNDTDEIKYQGKLEQPADKTIKYIDYLGHLLNQGDLKKTDLEIFKYEIKRILGSTAVQSYIGWLRAIGVSLNNIEDFNYLKKIKTIPTLNKNNK